MNLDTSPTVLSGIVRNIVIARAIASTYDRTETQAQAIAACRAVARHKLGQQRLSSAQAAECDAIVIATRSRADAVFPSAQAISPLAIAERDDTAILTALGRIERLLMTLVALLAKHFASRNEIAQSQFSAPSMPMFGQSADTQMAPRSSSDIVSARNN